jgi:POT family proton-dependent oligopeptide transporter
MLMFVATAMFWLGRQRYVKVPPVNRVGDPDAFSRVVRTALVTRAASGRGRPGSGC